MPRLIVHGFTISLDGYGAGPQQSLEAPLGVGAEALHDWMVRTRSYKKNHGGGDVGEVGVDNDIAERVLKDVGAWIHAPSFPLESIARATTP